MGMSNYVMEQEEERYEAFKAEYLAKHPNADEQTILDAWNDDVDNDEFTGENSQFGMGA